eukprot:5361865-Pleurochrysis_carterae.AAC.1
MPVSAQMHARVLSIYACRLPEPTSAGVPLALSQATLSPFGPSVMSLAGSALSGDLVLASRNSRAFYSHRWYCPGTKEPHPDDADNNKLKQLQMLLRGPQSDVEFIW